MTAVLAVVSENSDGAAVLLGPSGRLALFAWSWQQLLLGDVALWSVRCSMRGERTAIALPEIGRQVARDLAQLPLELHLVLCGDGALRVALPLARLAGETLRLEPGDLQDLGAAGALVGGLGHLETDPLAAAAARVAAWAASQRQPALPALLGSGR
jgi:hypothetical protein